MTARIAPTNAAAPMTANSFLLSFFFVALQISAAQAMQTAAATSVIPSVSHSQENAKGPALAQEPGCGAIGCYSAGGVHRSPLPPEEPPLLPPLSGAGVTTSGVWRRVAEAA